MICYLKRNRKSTVVNPATGSFNVFGRNSEQVNILALSTHIDFKK